ncbi:MAG: hypothetical protein QM737_07915 [Ferruginibacter sp.]
MAEQEVIKHTKAVYKVWNSKEHSFWHKLKEFLLEIFIIVFAISVSLWFHNRSEHQHQQKDVKEFLLGLKADLQSDIKEMQSDKSSYLNQKAAFSYISKLKMGEPMNVDSLRKHYTWVFNTTGLNPNDGRFEGFKASGKIGTIEDRLLQNDIMDLYQENIPSLLSSTNAYVLKKNALFTYVEQNRKRVNDSTTNLIEVLNSEVVHNLCGSLTFTSEITGRYDSAIAKMEKIIAGINKEYEIKD